MGVWCCFVVCPEAMAAQALLDAIADSDDGAVSRLLSDNPALLAQGGASQLGSPRPSDHAVVAAAVDDKGNTAVHIAASMDEQQCMSAVIGADKSLALAARNKRGNTALHCASQANSLRCVRLLLELSAAVNAQNEWGETALHLAASCSKGNQTVVGLLLHAGASVSLQDKWARTAEQVANEQGYTFAAFPPSAPPSAVPAPTQLRLSPKATPRVALSKLVEFPGDAEAVQSALSDPNVDVAGRDAFGLAALHKFAAWGQLDLLRMLALQLDSDQVNMTGGDGGYTALHHAIEMGSLPSVRFLLADSRVRLEAVDKKGRTALDLALELGDASLIDVLRSSRASPASTT